MTTSQPSRHHQSLIAPLESLRIHSLTVQSECNNGNTVLMSSIRTNLPIATQPWEAAKARFLQGLSAEQVDSFRHATVENIFYVASVAQRKHAQQSKTWALQQRLSPLMDAIKDYGQALDVYTNAYPIVLSPIWGSIRVVIHVSQFLDQRLFS